MRLERSEIISSASLIGVMSTVSSSALDRLSASLAILLAKLASGIKEVYDESLRARTKME